jgi:GTP-binding protein
VVRVDEGKSFVLADIPGLIEGASEGVGLGHDFLRHIERTRVLVHVLDASGLEGRDPVEDFYKINDELFQYNPKLEDKPQLIVANKMDLPGAEENLEMIRAEFEPQGIQVFETSAATSQGVADLKYSIWELLTTHEGDYETFDEEYEEFEIVEEEETVIVKKEDGIYIVEGTFVERLLEATYFDDIDSLRYFQDALRKRGIVEELEKLGIEEGESVFICGYEFEFFH